MTSADTRADPQIGPLHEVPILLWLALAGGLAWAVPACLPGLLLGPPGGFWLREAWDVGIYWWAALPLMVAIAGLGGFALGGRSGRVVLALMAGHLLGMLALAPSGAGLGLLPLTVALLAVLALPQLAAAALGGWLGRLCARRRRGA